MNEPRNDATVRRFRWGHTRVVGNRVSDSRSNAISGDPKAALEALETQALMRMSTPAGMLRLLRASTVWLVGSEM